MGYDGGGYVLEIVRLLQECLIMVDAAKPQAAEALEVIYVSG